MNIHNLKYVNVKVKKEIKIKKNVEFNYLIMKTLLIIIIMIVYQSVFGQKIFKNINNETCIELYTNSDLAGEYTVYMVCDDENPLTEQDIKFLKDWKKIGDEARLSAVQLWTITGKRIESEREPMVKKYLKVDINEWFKNKQLK